MEEARRVDVGGVDFASSKVTRSGPLYNTSSAPEVLKGER